MKIKSRIYAKTLFVILCGELDQHTASITRMTMDDLFDSSHFEQVVIDLSELEFMDSTGIGVMIGRYKKLKTRSVPVFICNPSSHIDKIFKMTGLFELMPKIS